METKSYEGWSNYETWVTFICLQRKPLFVDKDLHPADISVKIKDHVLSTKAIESGCSVVLEYVKTSSPSVNYLELAEKLYSKGDS